MLKVLNEIEDARGMIGAGSGLYSSFFQTDGLYALLAPFVKTPFVKGETSEQEVKVSSTSVVGKILGVTTYSVDDTEIYLHRDSMNLLELINGKTIPLLAMLPDKTGYKFDGIVTYSPNSAEQENAVMASIKITPVNPPVPMENCLDIIKPTCQFRSAIPSTVELDSVTGTYTQDIETKYATGTYTATSDAVAIATATVTGNKLTITGVKEGSTIVRLETKLAGCASWKTTILVVVPKAGAPKMAQEPIAPTDTPNSQKR